MNTTRGTLLAWGAAVALGGGPLLSAQDLAGSQDHPLVPRFPGARIVFYSLREYDEYVLALGPADDAGQPERVDTIEGKVIRIGYELPAARSVLEVYRTYERTLAAAGFATLFKCRGEAGPEACGSMQVWMHQLHDMGWSQELDQRNLVSRLASAGAGVYVAVHVSEGHALLDVVEVGALQALPTLAAAVPGLRPRAAPPDIRLGAVASSSGRLDLFAHGTDGMVWHMAFGGAWSRPENLSGVLGAGVAAASWGAGRLDVFTTKVDSGVYHKVFDGSRWSEWEPLGGTASSAPTAVAWSAGRLDLFVRGTDNALYHKWYDGRWSGWEWLGGALASGPAVASWAAGRLDVFARGTDNTLQHKWYDGRWSSWESLGVTPASELAAVSWGPNRIDVFARGADNTLQHKWYDGAWSGWESLGGQLTSSPAAASWGPDRIDVFARGADTALYHKSFSGSWSDWTSLGSEPSAAPVTPPGQTPAPPASQPVSEETRPAGAAPDVRATAPGPTSVALTWGATAQAQGYSVYRDGTLLTSTPVTDTAFVDAGRRPKASYTYTVAATYGASASWSPGTSAPVMVTTPPALPPAEITAKLVGTDQVVLTWSARRGATRYVLARNGIPIGGRIESPTYTDRGLATGTYSYTVNAIYSVEGVGEALGERTLAPTATASTPVWGFADTHTHQFSSRGFGGQVLWGQPFSPRHLTNPDSALKDALPWCDFAPGSSLTNPLPVHGPEGTLDNLGRALGEGFGGHHVGGFPEFDGWPTWHTFTHQQMYHEWLKRAVDGGLRLMVMHATNSEVFCAIANSPLSCPDMEAADRQFAAAREMEYYIDQLNGGPGKGWYRIVRTPREAREAMNAGKLAVVLGLEVQNLFNCRPNSGCTQQQVRDALQKYYDLGVRHIHPVHNVNNGFGGAAIYHPLFNFNNKILTGEYFTVRECGDAGVQFHLDLTPHDPGAAALISFIAGRVLSLNPTTAATAGILAAAYAPPAYPSAVGHCNQRGLTRLGESLIEQMMRRGMIIDIDHTSFLAADRILAKAESAGYAGVVAGHTGFIATSRGEKRSEGQKTESQVQRIAALGGLIGAITHQGDTSQIPTVTKVPHDCSSSTKSWAQAYLYAVSQVRGRAIPYGAVALGSDFDGFAGQPGPRFGPDGCGGDQMAVARQTALTRRLGYPFRLPGIATELGRSVVGRRTFDFNEDGLAHVGMLPDFIADLKDIGLNDADLEPLFRSAEAYVQMWERAERFSLAATTPAPPPLYVLVEPGPSTPTGGTVTVFVADRASGAGVPARVLFDGQDRGAVGQPLTFELKYGPTGQDDAGQPVMGVTPPAGSVSAPGYPSVPFSIAVESFRTLAVSVSGSGSAATRRIVVTVKDAHTAQPLSGTVFINGVQGATGVAVSFPACVETRTAEYTNTRGVPATRTVTARLPCPGVVRVQGYPDTPFTEP